MCVIGMVAIVVYKVAEKSTRNKYPKIINYFTPSFIGLSSYIVPRYIFSVP